MNLNGLKVLLGGALLCVLVSCSTQRPPQPIDPVPAGGPVSGPIQFQRPNSDGAPWWDIDVSQIPDAVPMVHTGNFKASPYTVRGKRYYPMQDGRNYQAVGTASWYGTKFHGQATANGEAYDLYGMTAAHKTLPLPSYVRVTNLENGLSVVLRVNDRGPFYSDRIIDLSFAAAKKLGFAERGTAPVKVEGIDPERWWAEQGRGLPRLLAAPASDSATVASAPTPAPAVVQAPAVIDSKKNDSVPVSGLYLQLGAFANPDAAELLRAKLIGSVNVPVFISSVVRDQQVLHRVRLGPIHSESEVVRLQDSMRTANLGQAALVRLD